MEDLRLAWLEKYFSLGKQVEADSAPILLETRIEYHHAIRMFDQPAGLMWIDRLHSHQWQMKAEIRVEDKIMAIAEQKGVFVDLKKWKPIRIPENLKQLYWKEKGNEIN